MCKYDSSLVCGQKKAFYQQKYTLHKWYMYSGEITRQAETKQITIVLLHIALSLSEYKHPITEVLQLLLV